MDLSLESTIWKWCMVRNCPLDRFDFPCTCAPLTLPLCICLLFFWMDHGKWGHFCYWFVLSTLWSSACHWFLSSNDAKLNFGGIFFCCPWLVSLPKWGYSLPVICEYLKSQIYIRLLFQWRNTMLHTLWHELLIVLGLAQVSQNRKGGGEISGSMFIGSKAVKFKYWHAVQRPSLLMICTVLKVKVLLGNRKKMSL